LPRAGRVMPTTPNVNQLTSRIADPQTSRVWGTGGRLVQCISSRSLAVAPASITPSLVITTL
jgi:hypothetical protein